MLGTIIAFIIVLQALTILSFFIAKMFIFFINIFKR